jgi:hypothetical protein
LSRPHRAGWQYPLEAIKEAVDTHKNKRVHLNPQTSEEKSLYIIMKARFDEL